MRSLRRSLLALLLVSCGLTDRNGGRSGGEGSQAAGAATVDTAGGAAGDAGALNLADAGGAEGGRPGAAGTAGVADTVGAAGRDAVDPDDPLDPLGPNAAVCDAYLSAWRLHSAEQSSGDAGACFQCLGNQPPCFDARQAITEGQEACFLRHCLCDPMAEDCATFEYPADVCGCFASCLPEPPHPSRQGWVDYITCEVENCSDDCR